MSARYLILAEGFSGDPHYGKTMWGVMRYRGDDVVAILDSTRAGETTQAKPVVGTVDEALRFEPDTALVGVATQGGRFPPAWIELLKSCITRGLSIENGLHVFLSNEPEFVELARRHGVELRDLRKPPPDLSTATGENLSVPATIVLTVGSDCAIGKMTVSCELDLEARRRGAARGRGAGACAGARCLTLVAVISDTHMPRGGRVLPRACVDRLKAADLVLHAGDVVDADVLGELERLAPVVAVHGNMDRPDLVAALPRERVVEVDEIRIGMVHIAGPRLGREDRLVAKFPGCAAVVYGHTHVPQVELHDGVWILNPGSPTERRRAPERTMLELRVDGDRLVPELVPLP